MQHNQKSKVVTEKDNNQLIDFSTILAASIHDMKNSLCLLLQSIDTLSLRMETTDPEGRKELAQIHYETQRLNTHLLQLLSLYRLEQNKLPLDITENFIVDLLEEVRERNILYSETKQITVEINTNSELVWYFDYNLILHLLNDIFVNAMRYTRNRIYMSASVINQQLHISVIDNGKGFPISMIDSLQSPSVNLIAGKTGLGLYFADLIAKAHCSQGKVGQIQLLNNQELKENIFTIILP